MNITQEVRIVRWSIIIALVASPLGLTIIYVMQTGSNTAAISITSSFGEITLFDPKQSSSFFFEESVLYQDNNLSFQISKPNDSWEIHTASDKFLAEELVSLKSKGYVDGIYLEKQHDKRFLVTVFDVQTKDFQLKDFIEDQILLINLKSDVKIPIKNISPSNNWAIFSMDMGENIENRYGEQILFLIDERLYMLQYYGNSPEYLAEKEKEDFRLILDSFEVLS